MLAKGEVAETQAELRVRALNFGLVYRVHGKLYLGLSFAPRPRAASRIILCRGHGMPRGSD